MKIAIISDIHDNLVNLKKCLDWCGSSGTEEIVCCGDVTNSDTLNYLSKNFANTIHLVKGNMELYDQSEIEYLKNIKYYGKTGRFNIDNLTIGACHEPYLFDRLLEMGKYDFIFYGHTHRPWEEEKDGVKMVNPGTLSAMFQQATFALLDSESKKIQLLLLENI